MMNVIGDECPYTNMIFNTILTSPMIVGMPPTNSVTIFMNTTFIPQFIRHNRVMKSNLYTLDNPKSICSTKYCPHYHPSLDDQRALIRVKFFLFNDLKDVIQSLLVHETVDTICDHQIVSTTDSNHSTTKPLIKNKHSQAFKIDK